MATVKNNDSKAPYEEPGLEEGKTGHINSEGNNNADEIHEIEDDFDSPLSAPVTEKAYSRPDVKITADQFSQPIPEPDHKGARIDLTKPVADGNTSNAVPPNTGTEAPKQPQQPFNPQMTNLSGKDKRSAAERAVDTILDGYAWAKQSAQVLLKISKKKIRELETSGKVDMMARIPIDNAGNMVTIGQYIEIFNEQNGSEMVFDAQSREDIRPVMVKYFEENNIGLTVKDELLFRLGKEVVTFGFQMFEGLTVKKQMVNQLIEITRELRAANRGANFQQSPGPQPAAPAPSPGPAPAATPAQNTGNFSETAPVEETPPEATNFVEPINTAPDSASSGSEFSTHPLMDSSASRKSDSLAMMGPDAALKMTGAGNPAINDPNKPSKGKPGRPSKKEITNGSL